MTIVLISLGGLAVAAPEVCNGVDDDADGRVDEPPLAWAADADGDGDGDRTDLQLTESCAAAPPGTVASVSDCDDSDPGVLGGAPELCNGVDDDCDGHVDESGCACSVVEDAGSAFQICTTPATWFDARDACAAEGYHLASIDSQAVQDAVFAAIQPYGIDFWMGLQDLATEGVYVWDDGTPLSYENYRYNEPNDYYMSEDCTELERNTGLWDDQDCTYLEAWVCERECTERLWFDDDDGDGLGDPSQSTWACDAPSGHVSNDADCDDQDPALPGVWYTDSDGDGIGGAASGVGCSGDTLVGGDCDDTDPAASGDCDTTPIDTGTPPPEPTDTGTPPPEPTDTDTGTPPEPDIVPDDGAAEPADSVTHAPPEPAFGFGLGCATTPAAGAGWLVLALGALAGRRRS